MDLQSDGSIVFGGSGSPRHRRSKDFFLVIGQATAISGICSVGYHFIRSGRQNCSEQGTGWNGNYQIAASKQIDAYHQAIAIFTRSPPPAGL